MELAVETRVVLKAPPLPRTKVAGPLSEGLEVETIRSEPWRELVGSTAAISATGALEAGVQWLVSRVEDGTWRKASPVGFYFAKLWYYEKLYPELTIVGALGAALSLNRIQKSLRSAD